jgi:hypothetical protein
MVSSNNLRQIASALHDYHEAHGRFPPAIVRAKDGRPQYSWRVLVLPYLESTPVYRQFKLEQPWDSPENQALLAHMPKVFAPPTIDDLKTKPSCTYYQVFVGKATAFDSEQGLRMPDDFPNGTSNTILVVEAGEAVPWTKPADVTYEADEPLPLLGGIFTSPGRFSIFGPSRTAGFNVAMVDGSVHFIPSTPSALSDENKEKLRALITRLGDRRPDPAFLQSLQP